MKSIGEILANTQENEKGCWVWQRCLTTNGYGRVIWKGKNRQLHQVVWEELRGECPEGLEPDHTCVTRACCNPDHIEWVTQAENKRRQAARKVTCINGHPRTKEHVRVNSKGAKFCWTCKMEKQRARRAAA